MRMAREKKDYICSNCGYRSAKWLGRCPSCGEWESFETPGAEKTQVNVSKPVSLAEATGDGEERWLIGWRFTDRMLGGGLVPGSLLLMGGAPGVGKSTLLLQWADILSSAGKKVLYCSAEESIAQLRLRASRLGALSPGILVVAERRVEGLEAVIESARPDLFILDSIQMVHSDQAGGAPGSLSQVRECAARLMEITKSKGITGIIVGHITKEGTLAGPKSMEHMVDVVLQLEGERGGATRILRVSKNRYGPTLELAVLTMTKKGLLEVDNPSQLFLKDRQPNTPGSVVTASLEGNSPLLLEVQALVGQGAQGMPRRVVMGAEVNRVFFLTAVLEKIAEIPLGNCDIFLNVPGGMRLAEPPADLAIVLAMVSSCWSIPFLSDTVVFGEIGLGGEVRTVSGAIQRIQEAIRMGFKRVLMPRGNAEELGWRGSKRLEVVGVKRIEDALQFCHNGGADFEKKGG